MELIAGARRDPYRNPCDPMRILRFRSARRAFLYNCAVRAIHLLIPNGTYRFSINAVTNEPLSGKEASSAFGEHDRACGADCAGSRGHDRRRHLLYLSLRGFPVSNTAARYAVHLE